MRSIPQLLEGINFHVAMYSDINNQDPRPVIGLLVDEFLALSRYLTEEQGGSAGVHLVINPQDERPGYWCLGAWIVIG